MIGSFIGSFIHDSPCVGGVSGRTVGGTERINNKVLLRGSTLSIILFAQKILQHKLNFL